MTEEIVKRRGLLKKHAAVDYEVWQWKTKLEQSSGTRRVTKTEIQAYAVQAYKNVGIDTFKASDGWYRRWRVRWAKSGVVKLKDAKEEGDCEKTKESNCGTDNKVSISKVKQYNDIKLTFKSSQYDNLEKRSLNTGNEANEFENKTDNKINKYDFPNKLGLLHLQSICAEKDGQFVRGKISLCNSDFPEILSSVEDLHLKNNVGFKDIRFSEKDTNINLKSNLSEKFFLTDSKCTDLNCKQYVFENHSVNNSGEIEKQELNIIKPLGSIENSTTKIRNNSTEDIDCTAQLKSTDSCQQSGPNEIIIGSQSLPSSNVDLELFSSTSIIDQRDLDFGDDELFCDSCEDFHPRMKGIHPNCCKQKKSASFLRSVFEIKDPSSVTITEMGDSSKDKMTKKRKKELNIEDQKLKKQPVLLAKGKRYLVQFKSKVVNYALNHSAKQAASTFKVNRGSVSAWLDEIKRSTVGSSNSKPRLVEELLSSDDSEFLSWLDSSKFNLTNELIKHKTGEWLKLTNNKCDWLRLYAYRLNGLEDNTIKKHYIAYPDAFKRMVVFHAQTHTNMAAARVFGVARRRVVQWQEMFNDTRIKPERTTSSNVTDEVVDKELFNWFISQNPAPSSKQVRIKGLELYRAAGYQSIQCGAHWYYRWRARHKLPPARDQLRKEVPLLSWALTQLDNNQCVTHVKLAQAYSTLTHSTISRGWTFRFCRKYHKLLQSVPEPTAILPLSLERQVATFRQTMQDTLQKEDYSERDIIAMDEVPLHFLPKDSSKKPLLVRRPGFENCQATLIVSSLADGTLLPTMFVFKGATPSVKSEPCVVPVANDLGLVSDDVMIQWLTSICSNQLQGRNGLLITDCFDIHMSKEVQQTMANHQIHHAVIPGGCSFKLFPITRICQLFKKMLEDMCKVSLAKQTAALSSPSPDQIYIWSVRVHKHLTKYQKENIQSDFKEMLFHPCSTSC